MQESTYLAVCQSQPSETRFGKAGALSKWAPFEKGEGRDMLECNHLFVVMKSDIGARWLLFDKGGGSTVYVLRSAVFVTLWESRGNGQMVVIHKMQLRAYSSAEDALT